MMHPLEKHMRNEARRKGFALQKRDGGYVITDKIGNGIVRATPTTLKEVEAFLESEGK